MRVLVGLVLALGLVMASAPVDARTRGTAKRSDHRVQRGKTSKAKKAAKRSARIGMLRERDRLAPREVMRGQSIGAPSGGRLQEATQLSRSDGYHIRRPGRSFGTQAAVELTERAITATLETFPDLHVLAIGDLSAEGGGPITEHRSHQSGRDVDIGLYYLERPDGYPASFVAADEDNLDSAATFTLIENLLASTNDDGGVQVIFLDYDIQGLLYYWALDAGVSERRLAKIFQYPHGRGMPAGLVRHEPNHDNHIHVRFKCPAEDTACR
jgi:murein endopeptidase